MKQSVRIAAALTALLLIACCVGGCRKPPAEISAPVPAPEETATPRPSETEDQVTVRVYFSRGEKIGVAARSVKANQPVETQALEAMKALLEGPSAEETEFGLGTVIPAGTSVNGVEFDRGVATVDLSKEYESGGGSLSMMMRIAQVVCTLTQFPGVDSVAFRLAGTPLEALGGEGIIVSPSVTRADFEGMLPPILVESPAVGETITSPVVISGSSNVFEATHHIELTDPDGLIIAEKTVTATSGTGTRGIWEISVPYSAVKRAGLGEVIAFELSAKDGKRVNIVEVPVRFAE